MTMTMRWCESAASVDSVRVGGPASHVHGDW